MSKAIQTVQPVEGSIQWAMNRGTLYQVDGVYKYGTLTTRANDAQEAAEAVLYKCSDYSVWVPPGTVLTAWNVYAGTIGGFQMRNPQRFVVRNGHPIPLEVSHVA